MARIVMLDQDGSLQHLLHAVLAEAGYHVVETHNSYEGLQYDQATRTAVPTSDIVYLVASSVSARPQERREGGGCMARILVVDDEVAIRELLRAVLEHEGYEVSEARNGAEGLRRYQGAPTDLVMIDMQMSGMDGLVLMLALQRAFPRVKVIAISGDRRRLEVARTFTPHTVEKPFALDEVRTTVSRALQDGRGDKAL